MKHLRIEDDITVTVRLREITLDYRLRVTQVDESFHVLGDEYFRFGDVDHLFHPEIEFAASLFGRFILSPLFAGMILIGLEAATFAGDTEVLTRETTRNHVNFLRKNRLACPMPFDQVDDTVRVENRWVASILGQVMRPSCFCLGQDIVSEDRMKTVRFQSDPIIRFFFINPVAIGSDRFLVADKTALKSQVHAAASREKGEQAQIFFLFIIHLLRLSIMLIQ